MMTPEQQRIEIAESLGWHWYRARGTGIITFNTPPTTKREDWVENQWDVIPRPDNYLMCIVAFVNCPDYLNDIDEIRQVYLQLSDDRKMVFLEHLLCIVALERMTRDDWPTVSGITAARWIADATAAQWTEAYLHVIGKLEGHPIPKDENSEG